MAFSKVGNFLDKFIKLQASKEKNGEVAEFIKSKNQNLKFNLAVKNKTIFFYDLTPAAKSELFLRREGLIKELKKNFGDMAPDDINFRKP